MSINSNWLDILAIIHTCGTSFRAAPNPNARNSPGSNVVAEEKTTAHHPDPAYSSI